MNKAVGGGGGDQFDPPPPKSGSSPLAFLLKVKKTMFYVTVLMAKRMAGK